jgi:hypothetical protein
MRNERFERQFLSRENVTSRGDLVCRNLRRKRKQRRPRAPFSAYFSWLSLEASPPQRRPHTSGIASALNLSTQPLPDESRPRTMDKPYSARRELLLG